MILKQSITDEWDNEIESQNRNHRKIKKRS